MKQGKKNINQYNRVCILDTLRPLFLYLLISSQEEIQSTYFFFSEGVAPSIRKNLPHTFISKFQYKRYGRLGAYLYRMILRFTASCRWSVLRKAELFAQDHEFYAMSLIGSRNYTLLEDGSANYTFTRRKHSPIDPLRRFLFGAPVAGPYGDNPKAKEIIMTGLYDTPFMREKNTTKIDINALFYATDTDKQNKIMQIFGIQRTDIKDLAQKSVVLFTQTFSEDKIMSESEKVEVYKNILSRYDNSQIVIKTHPRETTDYRKLFPGIYIFDKIVPMELLSALGVRFKKAVTVNSTAAASLPYQVEIDWVGIKIHPAIEKAFEGMAIQK